MHRMKLGYVKSGLDALQGNGTNCCPILAQGATGRAGSLAERRKVSILCTRNFFRRLSRARPWQNFLTRYISMPILRPCHNLPGRRVYHIQIQSVDRHHPRIEHSFGKYFHRTDKETTTSSRNGNKPDDEIEILVGHPNVLRYFLCRALQLPPETYSRFVLDPCSITYVAIYPNGVVTCRTVGDIGHLSTNDATSSTHRFLW